MKLTIATSAATESALRTCGGVFYMPNIIKKARCRSFEHMISECELEPLRHNGMTSRYEGVPPLDDPLAKEYERAVANLSLEIYETASAVEVYVFKYLAGQRIPWHKDNVRHNLTAIAYLGDFGGGEFIYRDRGRRLRVVDVNPGDVLVSINRTRNGTMINPWHAVRPILSGERLCLVASVVSAAEKGEANSANKSLNRSGGVRGI